MLRIKKPQPESLSGYIRKRLDVRQRRALQVQALEDEHRTLAEWEDEWEAILKQQGLRRSRAVPKATYVEGVQDALRMIKGRITTENRHHYTIARRMQEIVLKERRLALREKRRRRRGRRRINLRLRKTAAGKRMERKKAESPRSIERKTARGGAKRRRAQLPTLSRQEVGCEEGPGLQRRGGGEEKASIEVRCGRGKGASRENEGSREVRGAKKSVASLVRRTTRAQQTPSKTKTESEVDEVRQRARQVEKVNRRKDKSEETETPSPRKAGQKRSAQEEPREDIMRRMTRGKDAV